MDIVYKKISDIIPYENNPRNNEVAVEYVMKSIQEFGFKVPIIIDKKNVIIAGHTRYEASKRLGLEEVPCIVADKLNEKQIKAYRLIDNRVAEYSKWDYEKLNKELEKIKDMNLGDFGFDIFDDIGITDEDFVKDTEIPKEKNKKVIICSNCGREFEV